MAELSPTSTRFVAQRPSSPSVEVDCYAHFAICRFEDGRPDLLGTGGMGTTYRAFDLQLQRPVALKTINPQHVYDLEARSRFLREARAAARIQHPHVAGVLFQGEEKGTCFYVMELVAGESLAEYVVRVGSLDPASALALAHQVALALDAAHREQVLHRDLKPGNIMLTRYHDLRQLHVKVIDFGLAKLLQEGPASFASLPGFVGTPGFASPEQCQEQILDARSDLYSLGATLWFMLTGGPPFMGSALSVIQAHVSTEPDYDSLPACPEPVLVVLRRLLAKNPDERPASALEAADEIAWAQAEIGGTGLMGLPPLREAGGISVIVGDSRAPVVSRSRYVWAGMGVMGLCLLGAGVWWAGHKGRSSKVIPEVALETESPQVIKQNTGANVPPLPVQTPPAPPAVVPAVEAPAPVASTELANKEFVNSLGMKFRPLGVLPGKMSVWETRLRDFRAFAEAADLPSNPGKATWDRPGFEQDPDHPVVWVSMMDADKFCQWLTRREQGSGVLKPSQYYRLPTRLEFDAASGRIPPEIRAWAATKLGVGTTDPPPEGSYPWGSTWPPPAGAGNFADQSALAAGAVPKAIDGYDDGRKYTAPVGSYSGRGFPDLVGNVWEWVISRPGVTEGGARVRGGIVLKKATSNFIA